MWPCFHLDVNPKDHGGWKNENFPDIVDFSENRSLNDCLNNV